MFTQQFFVEGLGCASYMVGCEAMGIAAVIDPDRQVVRIFTCMSPVERKFPTSP
jgi:hypothetical protein